MPSFELEDVHGNQYNETTRKHLPARLINDCEGLYNAKVHARKQGDETVDNPFQARSKIKDKVISYFNNKDFENDLGPDEISPESQDKILKHYQEYLPGITYKEEESGTGKRDSGGNANEAE